MNDSGNQGILDCAINQVGNPWLSHETECHQAESDLGSQLKTESINLMGLTFRYYVVEGSDPVLFRGFQIKTIERAFKIKMSMEDLPGQQRIAGLMGLFDDTGLTGLIAMKHWKLASTYGPGFGSPGTHPALKSPRIGDILYSEANGLLYDIVSVTDTDNQFMYRQHTWQVSFKPFEDKKYKISLDASIAPDDPIRQIHQDVESSDEEAPSEYIFSTPKEAIEKNARIYQPGLDELPPANDKDNPFPKF